MNNNKKSDFWTGFAAGACVIGGVALIMLLAFFISL